MQHITDDIWVDFVRGTLAPDVSAAVDRRLKSGCERCLHAREMWRLVRQRADREGLYNPPEDALAFALAQFRTFRAERKLTPTRRTPTGFAPRTLTTCKTHIENGAPIRSAAGETAHTRKCAS